MVPNCWKFKLRSPKQQIVVGKWIVSSTKYEDFTSCLMVKTTKNFLPTCIEIIKGFLILTNLPIYSVSIGSNVLRKRYKFKRNSKLEMRDLGTNVGLYNLQRVKQNLFTYFHGKVLSMKFDPNLWAWVYNKSFV
jgi:hypothetical protein